MGYLPQDFGLPGNLTGREYLEYYALLYRIDEKDKIIERVKFLLEGGGWGLLNSRIKKSVIIPVGCVRGWPLQGPF